MSRLLTRLPDPHDPAFWVAAGIAAAAVIIYAGVVLAIALCSRNKKRRKRARKLLRQMFGGGRVTGQRGRPRSCPDDVLARVVAMRRGGARLVDICNALNREGVPTPAGRPTWWPSHVARLLRTRDALALLQDPGPSNSVELTAG